MNCPRCNSTMSLMSEKRYTRKEDKAKMLSTDYYCTNCKSGISNVSANGESFHSEWIDFNG
jgi:transposase-like protein